nr:unnamed protein product [Digitaria exilis]
MSSAALTKKTASRCTTEAARGEHVFEIVGYSPKRGLGVGKYAVDRQKMMCQSILSKNLSMENVATALALADQHNCDKLKEVCIELNMMDDMNALVSTQEQL